MNILVKPCDSMTHGGKVMIQ